MKTGSVCLAIVAGLSGIAVGGYYLWPEPGPKPPPPVETSTVDQNINYAASDDFKRLPMNKRLAWVEAQSRKIGSMDDDEFVKMWRETDKATRDRIANNMREVMRERTKKDADTYFKLPKDQQQAFLDNRLDDFKQWDSKFHKMMGHQRGARPAAGPTSQDNDPFRQQERRAMHQRFLTDSYNFMNNESADRRGKMFRYFTAMQKRRAERGEARFMGRDPDVKRQQ
jgi:hypothetical protein